MQNSSTCQDNQVVYCIVYHSAELGIKMYRPYALIHATIDGHILQIVTIMRLSIAVNSMICAIQSQTHLFKPTASLCRFTNINHQWTIATYRKIPFNYYCYGYLLYNFILIWRWFQSCFLALQKKVADNCRHQSTLFLESCHTSHRMLCYFMAKAAIYGLIA